MDKCCRNHCTISEGGSHCIHCNPSGPLIYCELCDRRIYSYDNERLCEVCIENFSCEACGSELNMNEGPLCDACSGFTYSDDDNFYQYLAPTIEEQMQRLMTIKVQLCEECKMPCEFIWCNDCGFD